MRWVRRIEQLKDAFERCATQVTNASDGTIEVQVDAFDVLDQATWETLRSGGSASKTWFFWANFQNGIHRVQYCFFFGRHYYSDADRDTPGFGPCTCLLISEQRGSELPTRLSQTPNCPLTLREILVAGDKLVRKRIDPGTGKEVYDLDIDAIQIARDFVQEVFLRRLT